MRRRRLGNPMGEPPGAPAPAPPAPYLTQREVIPSPPATLSPTPPTPHPPFSPLGVRWWIWAALGGALLLALWRRKDIVATVRMVTNWAHPTNFVEGRGGAQVDTIVLHTTEDTLASASKWFAMDHAGSGVGATSAHFIVGKDGTVVESVALANTAYHAGDAPTNRRSIGIELEGKAADPATFTPAMMTALVPLTRTLMLKYGIPAQRGVPGIIGHTDVPGAVAREKKDPGPYFPWDAFLVAVGGRRAA